MTAWTNDELTRVGDAEELQTLTGSSSAKEQDHGATPSGPHGRLTGQESPEGGRRG